MKQRKIISIEESMFNCTPLGRLKLPVRHSWCNLVTDFLLVHSNGGLLTIN